MSEMENAQVIDIVETVLVPEATALGVERNKTKTPHVDAPRQPVYLLCKHLFSKGKEFC